MTMEKNAEIKRQLHKENGNRWVGSPSYSCLTCSHAMSTELNELICVANTTHKTVEEKHVCENWI